MSTFKILWLASLMAMTSISTGYGESSRHPELQEIAGYREWKQLTDSPMLVRSSTMAG